MKHTPTRQLFLAAATLVAASSAHAATQAWNTGALTNNWNTTDASWDTSSLWTNGNDATFGGTGEAIALGAGITAHNLTFNASGYSIANNTLTLLGATPTISVTNSSDTATISSVITGSAGLVKDGAGTLTLSGTNTYTGGTTVNAGTLNLAGGGTGGSIRGALTINSGATVNANTGWSFGYTGDSTCVTGITIAGGTLNFTGTANFGGTSAGAITMTGGTISGSNFDWYVNSSAFSAPTLNTLASSTTATISSGLRLRLDLSSGAHNLTMNVAQGTVPGGVDLLVSGAIITGGISQGTNSGITKTGAGTAVFSGNNTYTGGTIISAGKLLVNNTTGSGTGSGSVSVNAGTLGGTGTISGAVTVANLATIRGGTGAATGEALTINGNVTLASGSIIELALGSGGTHSTLIFNGATDSFLSNQSFSFIDLGITAGNYTGIITGAGGVATSGWNFSGAGWQYTFTNNAGNIDLNVTAVPEPSTYGLIGAGALAAVAVVRRRRKLAGQAA